jgi:hypothetical protein
MKQWYRAQVIIIAAGTLFAWYTVIIDFMRFFDFHGTVFKIKDCIIPNPVTTPCFYGAIGFLVALIWSFKILKKISDRKSLHQQSYLTWFLLGGTIFGWANVALLIQRFLASQGKPAIGCSGQLMTNPLTTPCAYGAALYFAALVMSLLTLYLHRSTLKQSANHGITHS